MSESRLKLNQSMLANIIYMAEGNPGALVSLKQLMACTVDRDASLFQGLDVLIGLDSAGIYGSDVYIFFNDICRKNVIDAMTLIRGMQLGFVDKTVLADACHRQDRSGANIITFDFIASTYWKVKKILPNFNS